MIYNMTVIMTALRRSYNAHDGLYNGIMILAHDGT
jgi:hypothetical protein